MPFKPGDGKKFPPPAAVAPQYAAPGKPAKKAPPKKTAAKGIMGLFAK